MFKNNFDDMRKWEYNVETNTNTIRYTMSSRRQFGRGLCMCTVHICVSDAHTQVKAARREAAFRPVLQDKKSSPASNNSLNKTELTFFFILKKKSGGWHPRAGMMVPQTYQPPKHFPVHHSATLTV